VTDSLQLGFEALAEAEAREAHARLLAQLVPIAQGLARMRPEGITVADVRREAARYGLVPASAEGRELSFLGAVMKQAQLVATEEFRRSDVDASHGNLHRVWKRPGGA